MLKNFLYKKKKKKNNLPLIAGKVFIVSQKTKTALSSNLLKIPYIHPKKTIFYTCAKKLKGFVLGAVFFMLVKLSKVLNKTIKAISMFERL